MLQLPIQTAILPILRFGTFVFEDFIHSCICLYYVVKKVADCCGCNAMHNPFRVSELGHDRDAATGSI